MTSVLPPNPNWNLRGARRAAAVLLCAAVLGLGVGITAVGAAGADTYQVQAGDTLHDIAVSHGVSLAELLFLNPDLSDPDQIRVGQVLQVAGAGAPRTPEEGAGPGEDCSQTPWLQGEEAGWPLYATPDLFAEPTGWSAGALPCPTRIAPRLLHTWLQVQLAGGQSGWVKLPHGRSAQFLAARVVQASQWLAGRWAVLGAPYPQLRRLETLPGQSSPGPGPVSTPAIELDDDLARLRVAPHVKGTSYARADWQHWVDADGDCQNARAEVLIAESQIPVTFRGHDPCAVQTGLWAGPWGGATFTLAADLDIDHHVPLLNAHLSGGAHWTAAQKQVYANDLTLAAALQGTEAALNRQKRAAGPDAWRPPRAETWCTYAEGWVAVKSKYGLTVTRAEHTALREMLDTCP